MSGLIMCRIDGMSRSESFDRYNHRHGDRESKLGWGVHPQIAAQGARIDIEVWPERQ